MQPSARFTSHTLESTLCIGILADYESRFLYQTIVDGDASDPRRVGAAVCCADSRPTAASSVFGGHLQFPNHGPFHSVFALDIAGKPFGF